ncbi:MAG: hypothetical protein ACI9BD_001042 [Candidatus Marinamargulisbacteria bacterium]|jgi:hypothetical protein
MAIPLGMTMMPVSTSEMLMTIPSWAMVPINVMAIKGKFRILLARGAKNVSRVMFAPFLVGAASVLCFEKFFQLPKLCHNLCLC